MHRKMSKRKPYTLAEDKAILDFAEGHSGKTGGNAIWKLAEQQRLTSHSWQSMKDRYKLLAARQASKRIKLETSKTPTSHTTSPYSILSHITPAATSTSTSPPLPTSPSTPNFKLFSPSVYAILNQSTATGTSTSMPLSRPPPSFIRRPTATTTTSTADATTQTDIAMTDASVGVHWFCPVAHYRPVDVGTQTVDVTRPPPPSPPSMRTHKRSQSF